MQRCSVIARDVINQYDIILILFYQAKLAGSNVEKVVLKNIA